MRVLPHHYFGPLNMPGIFNLFYVPSDLKATMQDQYEAEKLGDIEGSFDNWLRIIETPFNVCSSVLSAADFVVKILSYFNKKPNNARMLSLIAKGTPILGLIVCAFESALEIRGISHAHSMLKLLDLPKSFEKLKNNPEEMDKAILHSLQRLNEEYCKKDPYIEGRIQALVRRKFPQLSLQAQEQRIRQYEQLSWGARDRSLIRRAYPRCAQKVHEMVPQLLEEFSRISLEDRPAWRTRACELLTDVKIQSYKKILMHVLGLLVILLTVSAIIAALCACPYVIPMVLLIIGSVLSTTRIGVSEGMMHTLGYKFDPYNLIPDYMKTIYQKIFKRSLQAT